MNFSYTLYARSDEDVALLLRRVVFYAAMQYRLLNPTPELKQSEAIKLLRCAITGETEEVQS